MSSLPWLTSLVFNPDRSDVVVLCETEFGKKARFPVHSCIICVQSQLFNNMLKSKDFSEGRTGQIEITGFSPRIVEYFLRFFYENTIPKLILYEHLLELLKIGHLYEVNDLVEKCSSRLEQDLTVDTVCEVYEVAELRQIESLTAKCKTTMKESFKTILQNDLHFALGVNNFQTFLESFRTSYTGPSEAINKACKRWQIWNSCAYEMTVENINEIWSEMSVLDREVESPYFVRNSTAAVDNISWVHDICLNNYLSDIDVFVEGNDVVRFPAHSLVLNKQSESFLNKWSQKKSNDTRCQITLKTDNPRIVEYFLRFLYTGFFPDLISEKNLLDLFVLAHEYKVNALKQKCGECLSRRLSLDNCCHVLSRIQGLETELKFKCSVKIASNLDRIFRNHLHLIIDQDLMIRLLRMVKESGLENNPFMKLWGKWHCIRLGLDLQEFDGTSHVQAVLLASSRKRKGES